MGIIAKQQLDEAPFTVIFRMARTIFPKCCCCIELKTGVRILGIVSCIGSGIAIISYIIGLVGGALSKHVQTNWSNSAFENLGLNLNQSPEFQYFSKTVDAELAMSIIGIIIFAFYLVSSILLIIGAAKESPKLLIPWMLVAFVIILFCFVSIILIFAIPGGNIDVRYYAWGKFGTFLVTMAIIFYFELVVLSLFNKLNHYDPAPQIT